MCVFCVGQCWGIGAFLGIGEIDGNIGDEPFEMGDNLTTLTFPNGFVPEQLNAGVSHSCAVSTVKQVACWGKNVAGQIGQGHMDAVWTPRLVDLGASFDVEFVSVGSGSTCAVSTNHQLKVYL